MNGIQSLMQGAAPQRPQPSSQPRPAMPNMANPRMGAAMGLVDDDLERAGIDPRTRAAMKAQEAVDLLASADADMAMGQPKPVPEKIIDQRKQQASEGVVGLLQQLMPGMQQRGQQMQRQRQRPPMGGMPARPAPARPPMGGMPAMGGMPSMGAPNMARMANGGIVGYAQGGTTTPTLGAVPPSAVGDEQIKQFAAQYTALQAGLAAATTPEDKAQSQRLIQDLIRDMGNQHATVMQYIDSTKGFVAPRTSGMAMGGQIKGYAGPDGSDVELDPELLALTEELLAEKVLPTGYTGPSSEERRAEYVVKQERRQQDRLDQQRERRDLKAANPELSGMDINKILERRDQQRAGRSAVGVNKPINLGGIGSLGQPRPEFRMQGTSNAGPSLIGAGREEDIFDPPVGGGMGEPQTKTATTEEQGILERMRTNQANVTSTTRTPSALETQLETALGTQLNVMDGARDKETALAEAALSVSEAEKQAAEELVIGDSLFNKNGELVKLSEREVLDGEFEVFHLIDVKDDHTYFAEDLLVHNVKSLPSPTCFAAGTKITLSDGSEKNIEDIVVGDVVKGWDSTNDDLADGEVIGVDSSHTVASHAEACKSLGDEPSLYTINDTGIEFTPEHPFLTADETVEGGPFVWKSLVPDSNQEPYKSEQEPLELKVGDSISHDGEWIEIESIKVVRSDASEKVYNITVKDLSSYIANGIIVHNK